MNAYAGELDNNFRHALQFLDTTEDLGDSYTLVDIGVHTVMDQPLLIFSEDGRTERATYPVYTEFTDLDDRTDVMLEQDTFSEADQRELGDWQDSLYFDILTEEARSMYRREYAKTAATRNVTHPTSIKDMFTEDRANGLYTPDDTMIDAFTDYLEDTPEL